MSSELSRAWAAWLLAAATGRMGRRDPDWAEAMLAEATLCGSELERLRWAWGCWVASLRASIDASAVIYGAALLLGVGGMAGYEWSLDESRGTVAVLALIAMVLGMLRPRRAWLSGVLVGLVVAGVIGFEAVSGIRPAYEARAQTLVQSLPWTALLVPALSAALLGAWLRRGMAARRLFR